MLFGALQALLFPVVNTRLVSLKFIIFTPFFVKYNHADQAHDLVGLIYFVCFLVIDLMQNLKLTQMFNEKKYYLAIIERG